MTTIGVCLPQLGPVVSTTLLRDFAQQAEEMGFRHLWVQDHFFFALDPTGAFDGAGDRQPDIYQSVWQPTELLAAVAGWTSTVELGSSILVAGNHWPVQLASRLATIDQLSDGRLAYLGLGVGWSKEEMRAMGVDPKTRGRRMEEFVDILQACWGSDPVEYHGELFDVPPGIVRPKPISAPALMSGMYSKPGLDRTARKFDLWNPSVRMTVAQVQASLAEMNASRPDGMVPLNAVYRLVQVDPAGNRLSIDEMIERARQCDSAGLTGIMLETNYDPEITNAGQWLSALSALQPVLEAVSND